MKNAKMVINKNIKYENMKLKVEMKYFDHENVIYNFELDWIIIYNSEKQSISISISCELEFSQHNTVCCELELWVFHKWIFH